MSGPGPLDDAVLSGGVRSRFLDDVNGLRVHVLEAGVSLTEIDHTNLMEAGLFFPEPSHEPEWIEENRARLAELGMTVP